MLCGGFKAGGTKFFCATADEGLNILEKISIPTTNPQETFNKVFAFFDRYSIDALGIGR